MRWTSNLTDTTDPFEGNHNADAVHNEIEFDTPALTDTFARELVLLKTTDLLARSPD